MRDGPGQAGRALVHDAILGGDRAPAASRNMNWPSTHRCWRKRRLGSAEKVGQHPLTVSPGDLLPAIPRRCLSRVQVVTGAPRPGKRELLFEEAHVGEGRSNYRCGPKVKSAINVKCVQLDVRRDLEQTAVQSPNRKFAATVKWSSSQCTFKAPPSASTQCLQAFRFGFHFRRKP